MKIQIGKCRTCGAYAYLDEVAGLRAVVGTGPVDVRQRMWDLVAGRLYLLDDQKLRVALPRDLNTPGAVFLADHEHRGAVRPVEGPAATPPPCTANPGGPERSDPQRIPSWAQTDATGTASFGPGATVVAAPTATPHPSEAAPTCDDCGKPCLPGTYVQVEYGSSTWTSHVGTA